LIVVALLFSGSEKEAMFISSEIGQMRGDKNRNRKGEEKRSDRGIYLSTYSTEYNTTVPSG
jgi:hypothetical protein